MSSIKDIANSFAEEYCSDAIYPSHLFKAVLHKSMGLVHFIETDLDKDYYYLQEWADIQMQLSPRAPRPQKDLDYSEESKAVMEEADAYREKFGLAEREPICILTSLVTPGVGFTFEQLKTLPLTASEIEARMGASVSGSKQNGTEGKMNFISENGKGLIEKYCVDLIVETKAGKFTPVIGFENEISVIFEILGRKTKSNLLITGEAGVGKTALLQAFATRLANDEVPEFLKGASAYELDLVSLAADAQYKGEVEDRFKQIVRAMGEQRGSGAAVLVIESVDKLFDKQGALYGCSSILKQELTRGSLQLLCTSSIDGYTKYIETDKEVVGKLEKLTVEEPTADLCLAILKGALPAYEQYHGLTVGEEEMTGAIRLAKRYLNEKALPDSAFDLIDRAMAALKIQNDRSAEEPRLALLTADLEGVVAKQTGIPLGKVQRV